VAEPITMTSVSLDDLCINTIRTLSMDAIWTPSRVRCLTGEDTVAEIGTLAEARQRTSASPSAKGASDSPPEPMQRTGRCAAGRWEAHGRVLMARSNTGTCELCKRQMSKSQMTRHIATCASSHDFAGLEQSIVQIRIDAAGEPRYWLHVEARSDASLEQLDSLLRRVWLECCGHMSAFRVGQRELPKRAKIGLTLRRKGLEFTYEYDFGSTTTLTGHVVGFRNGCLGRAATRLLARNDAPEWTCEECSRPAAIVCPFCVSSGPCLFCEAHAQEHPCAEEEVYLPVVNSPRMGVCGYVG
jgi:hypothetical protein